MIDILIQILFGCLIVMSILLILYLIVCIFENRESIKEPEKISNPFLDNWDAFLEKISFIASRYHLIIIKLDFKQFKMIYECISEYFSLSDCGRTSNDFVGLVYIYDKKYLVIPTDENEAKQFLIYHFKQEEMKIDQEKIDFLKDCREKISAHTDDYKKAIEKMQEEMNKNV